MSLDTSVPDVLFARSDFIASNAFGDAIPSLVPPLVRGRIGQILAFCNVHPPIMPLLVGMIVKSRWSAGRSGFRASRQERSP